MVFLRISLSAVIKEMISANVTVGANVIIGANGYTPFPDKKYFYVGECWRVLYMERHIHDILYFVVNV